MPDIKKIIRDVLKKRLKEESSTGAGPGASHFSPGSSENYATPFAFKKTKNYYTSKLGYKLVNKKKTRAAAGKVIEPKDMWHKHLNEIRVNNPDTEFLPIVQLDTGDKYLINYDNVITNIKRFKDKIAKYLDITDKNQLNKLLTYYVNYKLNTLYNDLYKDITLEEFLDNIANSIEDIEPEDLEPTEYDAISIQDIQETLDIKDYTQSLDTKDPKKKISIEQRVKDFDIIEQKLNQLVPLIAKAKTDTINMYRSDPTYNVIWGTDMAKDYLDDLIKLFTKK